MLCLHTFEVLHVARQREEILHFSGAVFCVKKFKDRVLIQKFNSVYFQHTCSSFSSDCPISFKSLF